MSDAVLEVRDLDAQYGTGSKRVKTVDGVSLSLQRGGVLGLVGGSGCGKTTTALAILGLLPRAGRVVRGEVRLEGRGLLSLRGEELRRPRHPYTWSPLAPLPRVDRDKRPLEAIKTSPPDPAALPDECVFLPRCRKAVSACRTSPSPLLRELAPGQRVACHNPVYHPEA